MQKHKIGWFIYEVKKNELFLWSAVIHCWHIQYSNHPILTSFSYQQQAPFMTIFKFTGMTCILYVKIEVLYFCIPLNIKNGIENEKCAKSNPCTYIVWMGFITWLARWTLYLYIYLSGHTWWNYEIYMI